MSIRIICRMTDAGAACNVGGPVYVEFKTFVVEAAEVEEWLRKAFDVARDGGISLYLVPNGARLVVMPEEAVGKAQEAWSRHEDCGECRANSWCPQCCYAISYAMDALKALGREAR